MGYLEWFLVRFYGCFYAVLSPLFPLYFQTVVKSVVSICFDMGIEIRLYALNIIVAQKLTNPKSFREILNSFFI